MAKTLDDKVEGLYDRKKLAKSLIAGEIASTVGAGLGAKIGEGMAKQNKLLGVIGGGIIGDYALAWPVGSLYWLWQNRDYYKGFKGKMEWLKDELEYSVREIPAVAASYAAYAPLAGLFYKVLGLGSVLSGGLASVAASAIYILGSMMLGRGVFKRKKVNKQKQASKKEYEPNANYGGRQPEYAGAPSR